jgi:hypothetical protein
MTASGKVSKPKMRELIAAKLAEEARDRRVNALVTEPSSRDAGKPSPRL